MIDHLSYSAVATYLSCGRSFCYRYVERLPAVLTGRQISGRAYHRGLAYALKRKMHGGIATVEELGDVISDSWEAQFSERVVYDELDEPRIEARKIEWDNDDPGRLKDAVIGLAGMYLGRVLPKLEPVAVEQKLNGLVGEVPFVGYIDLQLPNYGVVEHKFSRRKLAQTEADRDIQLSAYAALLQHPIWGGFHQAMDTKKPDINIVLTERGEMDIQWFSSLVAEVWRGIQSGIFPPNPLSWRCGGNCPYEVECRVLMEV